jgi:hypothetical protein
MCEYVLLYAAIYEYVLLEVCGTMYGYVLLGAAICNCEYVLLCAAMWNHVSMF